GHDDTWPLQICNSARLGGHFALGFVRNIDLGRADVFDFGGRGGVYRAVFAVELASAADGILELGQRPVFDPEFDRAFGIVDFRRIAAAAATETRQALDAVFGQ